MLPRFWGWLTNAEDYAGDLRPAEHERIDRLRAAFFVGIHLACLGVFWVGASAAAVTVFIASYLVRRSQGWDSPRPFTRNSVSRTQH